MGGNIKMAEYFFDFMLVSILIIGLTAFLADITNTIGKLFSLSKNNSHTFDQSQRIQKGWNNIGGKK